MIFDTHAHYEVPAFDHDRDELLNRLHHECGVSCIVNPSMHLESAKACVRLAEQYDFIYAAVGLHPNHVEKWDDSHIEQYRDMLRHPKVVAVGEIGLDYYRKQDNREWQNHVFAMQLELAKETNLPVIIHDREAHGDMYDHLRHYRPEGVMHCFSGSVELAKETLRLGMYIGLGGSVTFENAVRPVDVAQYVPLDRLVLETDAPYLIPTPCRTTKNRRERSDSSMIYAVAQFIAELRGMDTEELLRITEENAHRLYRI